ncbi:MAG: hypothetical protein V2I97_04445, partial [Desulfococcaceae bacterium]|nr:hypothetical protein [Desulfococcaceae bacterium]
MKSRYINCVLMAILLLLSVFPVGAGAVPTLIEDKEIPNQFKPAYFDPYNAVEDLATVFSSSEPLTYSASVEGDIITAEIVDTSLKISLNPDSDFISGTATVKVTATDDNGSVDDSFTVTVIGIPDQFKPMNFTPYNVQEDLVTFFKVTDSFTFSVSVDTDIVIAEIIGADEIIGSALKLSPNPLSDNAGQATVTVTATDGSSSFKDSFKITVPKIPNQFKPMNFDSYYVADLYDVFANNNLTFSVSGGNGIVDAKLFPDNTGSVLKLEPVFNASGKATVEVTAMYGDVTLETGEFDIYIYNKFLEPEGLQNSLLGNSVAISGKYAIAGAPGSGSKGAAYIFEYDSANGWGEPEKLTATDGSAGDYYGFSVAISGDDSSGYYAIVGAYNHNQKGAAYVYHNDGSTKTADGSLWVPEKTLTALDGISNDWFAYSVGIITVGTECYAVAGAPLDDNFGDNSGSVYIFRKSENWKQYRITATDAAAGDNFGGAVAVSAESSAATPENNYVYVLAGAKLDDYDGISNAGAAYVFKYNFISWSQQAKLTSGVAAGGDGFGTAVAMYGGDTAVVGPQNISGSGAKVFVFQKSGSSWPAEMTSAHADAAELRASDGIATDQFGTALSVHEHYILVGAYNDEGIGAAYLYVKEDPVAAWSAMTETKKIVADDVGSIDPRYGSAVGVYFDDTDYFTIIGAHGYDYDDGIQVNDTNEGAVYFNAEVSPGSSGATTVSDIADQIINMNTAANPSSYTADFTVCDPNSAATLTISATSDSNLVPAANITVNENAVPYNHTLSGNFCETLTLSVTPLEGDVGVADINVSVAGSTTATDTLKLTVTGQPIISDIADVTDRIGAVSASVPFTVSDPDTPIENVTVSHVSGNALLVDSNSGLQLTNTGNNFTLTITPNPGISGLTTITITADDQVGNPVQKSFDYIITAKPVITNVPNFVVTDEDTAVTVYFKVTDTDTLDANLTVSASSSDTSLFPSSNMLATRLSTPDENGNNWQLSLTPGENLAGNAEITISAKDEYSEQQNDTTMAVFSVTVTLLDDDPPVIERVIPVSQEVTADAPQTIDSSGGTITGLDADGNSVGMTLGTSDIFSVNMGDMIKVSNISGTMNINTNDVVTVYTGSIPKISSTVIPEDTVSENIQLLVDDPDGDFLTISVTSGNETLLPNTYPNIKINGFPSPYMVDTSDGKIPMMLTLSPVENLWETSLISITVTDDNGNTVTHSFLLTVSQVNDKPTISVNETMLIPIPDQTITAEESFKEITFYVNDLDGDTLTLEATATSANALLLPNDADHISINGSGTTATVTTSPGVNKTCTLKLTPTDGEWGAVDMVLKVTDGNGGIVNNPFVLRVNYVDKKLTISNIEDQTTRENFPISFGFIVGGLEAPSDQLQVDITSSNPMLVPDTQNIAKTDMGDGFYTVELTPLLNEIGQTTIYVILTDPTNGNKAIDDFVLTVTSTNNPPAIEVIGLTNLSTSLSDSIEVRFDVFDKETPAEDLIVSFEYTYKGIVYEYPPDPFVAPVDDPISQILVVSFENKIQVSNGLIIPGGQTTTLPDGYYADLVVKVIPKGVGPVMITVTVKDERNVTSNDYFNLLIYNSNLNPKIESVTLDGLSIAKDVVSIEQGIQTGEILVTLSDADNNPLKVSVTSNNTTLVPVTSANINFNGVGPNTTVSSTDYNAGPLSLYITPASGQTGEATITIAVDDFNEGTATEEFYLNVLPLGGVNIMPKIDSIMHNSISVVDKVIDIDENTNTGNIEIRVSDAHSDTLTVSVSSSSEDDGVIPNDPA